jgi:hypothetical protein
MFERAATAAGFDMKIHPHIAIDGRSGTDARASALPAFRPCRARCCALRGRPVGTLALDTPRISGGIRVSFVYSS